jgi:hypothetical protein
MTQWRLIVLHNMGNAFFSGQTELSVIVYFVSYTSLGAKDVSVMSHAAPGLAFSTTTTSILSHFAYQNMFLDDELPDKEILMIQSCAVSHSLREKAVFHTCRTCEMATANQTLPVARNNKRCDTMS